MMAEHDLTSFLSGATRELEREYRRIRTRAAEDPGTAGDQGEENWKELLELWLPENYKVVTKGRLIDTKGNSSPQIDVLVLHPSYPKFLRNKKLYLVDGVVAAFECKTTLRTRHISKAVETALEVKKLVTPRGGTPYTDTNVGLVYGLLAHSSDISKDSTKARVIIGKALSKEEQSIEHPKYGMDLLCVADLITSVYVKRSYLGIKSHPPSNTILETFYALCPHPSIIWPRPAAPVGVMLTELFWRLAWEDQSLQKLARYFSAVLSKVGAGTSTREWNTGVFSKATILQKPVPKPLDIFDKWTMHL